MIIKLIQIFTILLIIVLYVSIFFIYRKFKFKIEKNTHYQEFLPSKDMLIFYKGSPKKGIYINYLKKISKYCIDFIKMKNNKKKNKAIIADFDDTLVWTRPYKPLKLKYISNSKYGKVFYFPELIYIGNILRYARKNGYFIFIITSRPPGSYLSTIYNMERYKIPYDSIFTSSFFGEHPDFKAKIRRKIEKHPPEEIKGLNTFQLLSKKLKNTTNCTKIILSIGDNWYDIYDGFVETGIKLPSPNDFNAYIYYKNEIIDLI